MAIPEHAKCVQTHKRIRANHRSKEWRQARLWREKHGKAVKGQRIREMLNIVKDLQRARLIRLFGSYKEYINQIYDRDLRHYRRYGKYDD